MDVFPIIIMLSGLDPKIYGIKLDLGLLYFIGGCCKITPESRVSLPHARGQCYSPEKNTVGR